MPSQTDWKLRTVGALFGSLETAGDQMRLLTALWQGDLLDPAGSALIKGMLGQQLAPWLAELDQHSREQVVAAVELLGEHGPQLGRPLVDTVTASRHRNMKELRPGSAGRTELRVLFAFDPARQAILLVAGGKSGDWRGWYKRNIPRADDLFDAHVRRVKGR
ncbi:type II toxin-antitoxin system RelE/ParE family toxin [Brachybacterium halotolerans subsp. kimchii]|uniref:type II toxin-antitoxin system RelE/ParE family toxin n=1 Tax=Brachybacterium halotolerans TaxID=2795215 RepID=UPI001E369C62|nr:type II toxin-antitoxin system RelE/ParE family toxin [Brachybacterium halotolerans]UEJ81318.1 type II toxin-antitoxin system RelE/ParE family toxin [Brachybacterium halotolerans subsp. kimchii]